MELQVIQDKIYEIRGHKVMLDSDLAKLYEIDTKMLNRAVKRNADRFPQDFMFHLTANELSNLKYQIGTSSLEKQHGGRRTPPYAFTEHGILMLSSVLNSEKAIEVNITIMRIFVIMRRYALGYAELNQKLETFMNETNMQFDDVYRALTELINIKEEKTTRKHIGF
jgi:hypothetical protein